jgi:hypothetical protein
MATVIDVENHTYQVSPLSLVIFFICVKNKKIAVSININIPKGDKMVTNISAFYKVF